MKSFFAVLVLFASVANAGMEFNKGGIDHPTTSADGVYLYGKDAVIMFNALSVRAIKSGEFLQKSLSLDESKPATGSLITCSIGDGQDLLGQLKSAECYMGTVPQN